MKQKRSKSEVVAQHPCLSSEDVLALQRMISGALRDTMNAHGPVGPTDIGSATKRILGTITGNFCVRRRRNPTNKSSNRRREMATTT